MKWIPTFKDIRINCVTIIYLDASIFFISFVDCILSVLLIRWKIIINIVVEALSWISRIARIYDRIIIV